MSGQCATLHVTYHINDGAQMTQSASSTRLKVAAHRARMRALGLRPIQIWAPDVRAPAFRAEARRQSLAVAASSHGVKDQAFIDSISTLRDESLDDAE
jgi:hypothetical protein